MKLSLLCLLALALCAPPSYAQLPFQNRIDLRLSAKPYRDISLIKKKKIRTQYPSAVTDSLIKKATPLGSISEDDTSDVLKVSAKKKKCCFKCHNKKTTSSDSVKVNTENGTVLQLRSDSDIIPSDTIQKKTKKKKGARYKSDTTTVQETLSPPELTPEEIAQDLKESGDLNLAGNNFEQAMFYYNKIITTYTSTSVYPDALFARARCYMELNDKPAALNDISLYIKVNNCEAQFCSDAFYMRANIYFNTASYVAAIADFTAATKDSTFKNYKFCFFYRALCEGETGQHIQSVLDFTKFLTLDNYKTISSAEALYYRGFYKVKLSDNRGAINDYDQAAELYKVAVENSKDKKNIYLQKLIDTYITRALAKAEIKKYDEAILDYNLVIKMNPNYAIAYRLKGLAEINKGDLDNGCLDLSKAGELGSAEAYDDIKHLCK